MPDDVTLKDEERLVSLLTSHPPPVSKSKFKTCDIVRVSHLKGVFEKGYTPNWSTELFKIKNIRST